MPSDRTPLFLIAALVAGLIALMVIPREEEPQINVTMANVLIPFPGAAVRDVEQMVATPAEQVLSQIAGVEHVMSVSRPGMAIITVQFKVGVPRTEALVRLYDTVHANADWLPRGLGVLEPIVKPKGIDDVPIVTLTLYGKHPTVGAYDLERVAHSVEADLKRARLQPSAGRAARCWLNSIRRAWPVPVLPLPICAARCNRPISGCRWAIYCRATARWPSNPAPFSRMRMR